MTSPSEGVASVRRLTGEAEFVNGSSPIRFNNLLAGDNGSAMQASLSAAMPLAFVMQGGFDTLRLSTELLQIKLACR